MSGRCRINCASQFPNDDEDEIKVAAKDKVKGAAQDEAKQEVQDDEAKDDEGPKDGKAPEDGKAGEMLLIMQLEKPLIKPTQVKKLVQLRAKSKEALDSGWIVERRSG